MLIVISLDIGIKLQVCQELLVLLSIRVFLHQELLLQGQDVPFDLHEHTLYALLVVGKVVNEDGLFLLVSHQVRLFNIRAVTPTLNLLSLFLLPAASLLFRVHNVFWLKLIERCLFRVFASPLNAVFIVIRV